MRITAVVLLVLAAAVGGFAYMHKVSPLSWGWWGNVENSSGVAIDGYDMVAYQTTGKPQQGLPQHSSQWGGVTWHFSTPEHRSLFDADPGKYAPSYGGFCAFATSKGFTAKASGESWLMHDEKLYLFADDDVRSQWADEIADGVIERSNRNWAKRSL